MKHYIYTKENKQNRRKTILHVSRILDNEPLYIGHTTINYFSTPGEVCEVVDLLNRLGIKTERNEVKIYSV